VSHTDATAAGSGSGPWDLNIKTELWNELSGPAGRLTDELANRVLPQLRPRDDEEASARVTGLEATGTLRRVRTSWEQRLTTMREELGQLRDAFEATARDFAATEEGARQDVQRSQNASEGGGRLL
jgi:hypothetical protein